MKLYEVGGAIRDEFMGLETKDVDFAVEAPSFQAMAEGLTDMGFKIFLSTPEFLTLRAQVPKGHSLQKRTKVADFVLCRKDGPTKDGRRPEFVEPGTIYDDLKRRDFTINAIARDTDTNQLIDPFNGVADITARFLRFVGEPMDRIREDGLRVLRGFRFIVTKSLWPHPDTDWALRSNEAADMLMKVSVERIREELEKMFAHDTLYALTILSSLLPDTHPTIREPDEPRIMKAIFRDNLRLLPTMKAK